MSAVVDPNARNLEAACQAGGCRRTLEHDDGTVVPGQPVRGRESGGPGPEDRDVVVGHEPFAANAITSPVTATDTRSPGSNARAGPIRERTRRPSSSITSTSWS